MTLGEKLMAWFTGTHLPPHRTTVPPHVPTETHAHVDPRILELDSINRDNDARLERLGLSRSVLEERIMADEAWRSASLEDDRDR